MNAPMSTAELVAGRPLRDTRGVLARWNRAPGTVLWAWMAGAGAISVGLLLAVWGIASRSTPDPTPLLLPGLNAPASIDDVVRILERNSLVLALHAMCCVAGYLAGSSLPDEAERYHGWLRVVHDRAAPAAIAFVGGATLFSLTTQAYVLGGAASTLAAQGGVPVWLLLLGLLPHALPELVALFLPLAAWLMASRQNAWHELLAATYVTTAVAVPLLVVAAVLEVYVSPHALLWLRSLHFV